MSEPGLENVQDYYEILESPPTASAEEIRSAYRRLALRYHPDQSRHPDANRLMQLLNEAYEVLGDPEKKAQYDIDREAPVSGPADEPQTESEPATGTQAGNGAPPADESSPEPEPGTRAQAGPPPDPFPPVRPINRSRWDPERSQWLQNQFKILVQLVMLTMVLFALSLFSGQFILLLAFVPILAAIYTIFSIVVRINRPV